jgi:hypothetical protein
MQLRQLSPHEEEAIIIELLDRGHSNREFCKVMSILKEDPELRPLIFEHEILLQALTGIGELKAEYMLSILTAAETEMYESGRHPQDTGELNEKLAQINNEKEHFIVLTN